MMPEYTHTGPINCNTSFDTHVLKGKTAIVTGGILLICTFLKDSLFINHGPGANGLGEAYVRALVAAGYSITTITRPLTG